MKRHSMPDMKEGGVNVTPLIDIVMVLIIFFMLVAKIGVSRGEDENIKLPSAILGVSLESLSNTLTLNIRTYGNGAVSDKPQITALVQGNMKEIPVQDLENVLKEFHNINKEKANIILHADRDLPYSQLEQVLIPIAQAGILNVSYETKKGSDTPSDTGGGL